MALTSIVVATDFSAMAERALDLAIAIAAPLGASITVVHVYDIPAFSLPPGILVPTDDIVGVVERTSAASLETLVAGKSSSGVKIRGVLREGTPWDQIEAVANEVSADLVVIGTHGRRGLSRALLGSVAEKVLRTSKRPVLTVPPA